MDAADRHARVASCEPIQLVQDARAAADGGGNGRAGDAEPRKGPMPKMKQGPSTMLIALANQRTRIAMAASPAPRKIALMRNSSSTVALPPSIIRV